MTTEPAIEERTPRWVVPLALVAAWAAFFAPALFLGRVFYFRDLFFFHRPLREVLIGALERGEFPYINAGLNLGQPVLADPSYSVFYPANLLYLLLPFNAAWNLVLSGHVLWAAAGTYLLARALGAGRLPALAGAFAFGFSGPVVSSLNYYALLLAMSWAPWVGLAALTAWRRGGVAVPLAGLALAAQGLACEPTILACTAGALAAAWLAGLIRAEARGVLLARGLTIATIAGLVVAVQLVPAAMWLSQTDRGAALPFRESAAWWSLHPERLAELLAPLVNGNAAAERADSFWGGHLSDAGYPYVPRIYLGWLPLLLAPLAWRARWGKAALALGVAGFALALGRHLPGYEALHAAVPVLWITRYPEKFTMFGALGTAVALALGVSSAGGARKAWVGIAGAVLLTLAGALAIGASGVPPEGITARQEALRSGAIVRALAAGAAAGAIGLLLVSARGRRVALLLVPVFALCDVAGFTWEVGKTRSAAEDARIPRVLAEAPMLRKQAVLPLVELQSDRFFRGGTDPYGSMQEALYPYSGLRWGVRYGAVDDISRTMSARSAQRRVVVLEGFARGSLDAARASGIGAVISVDPIVHPELDAGIRTRAGGLELSVHGIVPPVPVLARFEGGDARVAATASAPHEIRVEVDANSAGTVVIEREAIPGWRATLDGSPAVFEGDALGLLRVGVPAGRHVLRLRYTPPGLGTGLVLSGAGLLAALTAALFARRRAARFESTAPGSRAL